MKKSSKRRTMRYILSCFLAILPNLFLDAPVFAEKITGNVGFEGQEFKFTFRAGRAASDAPNLPDPRDPAIESSIPAPESVPTAVSAIPARAAGGSLTEATSRDIQKDGFQIPDTWGITSAAEDVRTDNRIVFRDITFDLNSSTIKSESYPTLRRLQMIIQSNPGASFLIEGHTDSDGDDASNQQLSVERAEAVKAWLVSSGIDGSRLATQGFGESSPASSNDTAEGRAQNRRVEVVKR